LNIEAWRLNARRQGSFLHLGCFHPFPENRFISAVIELFVKILPSGFALFLADWPIFQMIMITAVGIGWLVTTVVWPPLIDRTFQQILVTGRVFTVALMLCGVLVAALEGSVTATWLPYGLVLASVVLAPLAARKLLPSDANDLRHRCAKLSTNEACTMLPIKDADE